MTVEVVGLARCWVVEFQHLTNCRDLAARGCQTANRDQMIHWGEAELHFRTAALWQVAGIQLYRVQFVLGATAEDCQSCQTMET